jgi:hypothetical protein
LFYPNTDTDSDHEHDNPHIDDSSDDAPSDKQEKSQSEEDSFESAEEVKDDLKPKSESSDKEKSSTRHSRRSSSHSSDEKSEESSNHGNEPDQRPENDSDDLFKESEPEEESEPEPGPSLPCRSSRVPKPIIKYGSAYGDKPAIQIEREIRSDKAWQKAVKLKAKAVIKQAHNTFHDDLDALVKEGGNKSIHYLLAQVVDIKKNPRELQYRNILRLKDSNPKSFQEW